MINGFENETAPLNATELRAAGIIGGCLSTHVGAKSAVTAQTIANALARYDAAFRDAKGRPYLNGARIRKIVNHLRTSGACPRLIASSKGYYVSNGLREIREYINSLRARAEAITAVDNAMEYAV